MNCLKLTQITNDGRKKVWKLAQSSHPITFGTSRKANLLSIDNNIESYQLAFELVNNTWHCINFDIKSKNSNLSINNNSEIKFNDSIIYLELMNRSPFVLKQLENISLCGDVKKNLVVVSRKNKLISTHLLNLNEDYKIYNNGELATIKLNSQSQEWQYNEVNGFQIKNKVLSVNSIKPLEKIDTKEFIDSESKKASLYSVGITLLLVGISFLAPKKNQNLVNEKKLTSSQSVVKMSVKKKKPKELNSAKAAPTTHTAQNQSNSGNKASALLKGAIGSRISQLLGKVSATDARTQNIILTTKGLKADSENSGRALAALGKTESSGRNWNGETQIKGTGVETAGFGGGNNGKNLKASLGQGKTGSGGVGLIEEESEITGGLDREVIAQFIKSQLGQILYCYERQLSATPDIFGKIAVRFTISGNGQVETQSINDTTLKNRSVENCILSKIAKWKFPEPKGGTKVLVTYPFLFKSTN